MPTLDWIGKAAVVNHHQTVPFRLLRPNDTLSVGLPDTGNLLVEGDNLEALKALLPYYAGQVKCIYIDPPYNTGNEGWMYNDNVNAPEMAAWLDKTVGKEAEDLSRHDKWLCMMYPRLQLLRQFLRDDGSIWVSIDDNEISNLRSIMDEVFGRSRYVATCAWQKRYSRENREAIGDVHEYLVVYANNPERFKATRNRIPPTDAQTKVYRNPNNDPRGRWRPVPITAQEGHATPEQFYEIVAPSGRIFKPPKGRCWSLSKETFERLRSENRIYFGKNGDSQPNVIRYLSELEGVVPWSWWPHDEVGHTDEAKKEIHALLGKDDAFPTPKPTRLMRRIIQIATNSDDLVLDSFAGSGTTGHAILQQNKEDGGNRRFILVEMEAKIARNVTAERLQRVICGVPAAETRVEAETTADEAEAPSPLFEAAEVTPAVPEVAAGLGGGFEFCTLGEPLFDENGRLSPAVTFRELARHIFYTETGEPLPETVSPAPPLLGCAQGTAVYLLWSGQDALPMDAAALRGLPPHDGPKVVYAASCRLSAARLRQAAVTFRQFPYDVKTS